MSSRRKTTMVRTHRDQMDLFHDSPSRECRSGPLRNHELYPNYTLARHAYEQSGAKMSFPEWLWAKKGATNSENREWFNDAKCAKEMMERSVRPRERSEKFFVIPLDSKDFNICEPVCIAEGARNNVRVDCCTVFRCAVVFWMSGGVFLFCSGKTMVSAWLLCGVVAATSTKRIGVVVATIWSSCLILTVLAELGSSLLRHLLE